MTVSSRSREMIVQVTPIETRRRNSNSPPIGSMYSARKITPATAMAMKTIRTHVLNLFMKRSLKI